MDRMDWLGARCVDRAGCDLFQVPARERLTVRSMRVRNRVTGWKRERAAIALSALGAALLAGCASEPAPVEDRSLGGGAETTVAPVRAQVPAEGTYRVVRG